MRQEPDRFRRWGRFATIVVGSVGLVVALGACQPPPVFVFGVTSAEDRVDAVPGDGRCATAAPEVCTLRAAVMEANAQAKHTQVLLPPGVVHLSLGHGDENQGSSDDLDIRAPLTITGDPESGSTIDAGGVGRVLDVGSGTTTLTQVTLTGGSTTNSGGGIQLRTGTHLVATDVTISGNSSTSATGGLKIAGDASADLARVTVSGNTGAGNGGIVNAGVLTARNTTVSGNVASDGTGGGVATPAPGTSTLSFTTVTANTGSGLDGDGAVDLAASIVADQASGADCTGATPTTSGFNLDSDSTCLPTPSAGDIAGGDAGLLALSDNGGFTATHRPGSASDATDAIPTGTVALCDGSIANDQRGRSRPTFGGCDIGAVETGDLLVNRSTDAVDAVPGDGICEATVGAGDCTLRAAVGEANATPGIQSVVLLTDVALSRPGQDNTNSAGDLDVLDPLIVVGGGHTVDAAQIERVFHATAPLTIEQATVTGGALNGPGAGGGILASSDLTLRFVTVRGNTTNGGHGGGIAQSGGALLVEDSTVAGNHVAGNGAVSGGGIRTTGSTATVVRSTITGNEVVSPTGSGGGIARTGAAATVWGSTISDNRAGFEYVDPVEGDSGRTDGAGGGGIAGPVTLTASTVSGNWSGGDGGGLAGPSITIRNSTIANNHADGGSWNDNAMTEDPTGRGGAVAGAPTVIASTIAGNSALLEFDGLTGGTIAGSIHADSCSPTVSSAGWNVTTPTCALAGGGDVVVPGVAVVGDLASNGGLTATMLPSSSVLDTIPPGTPGLCDGAATADQRGRPRPAGAACDSGSVERSAVASVSVVTDDPGDGRDATPGDGICATAGGGCTLRAAIDEANLSSGADTITLGVDSTLSRNGIGEDGNINGDLDIGTDLTIEGAGHVVDGGFIDRVLDHHSGTLTIGDVTLRRGALHGNDRTGGLVESSSTADLIIANSTLVDGYTGATGRGGAVHKTNGKLDLRSSTITATSAAAGAAVAVDAATTEIIDTTIAGAGPGPAVAGEGIIARTSIISSPAGGACTSPFATSEWNLVTDPSCGAALVADPQLGPLADNGGPTPTRLPDPGSPAINAIPIGALGGCDATRASDQRNISRPQGQGCDVGATEDDDGRAPPLTVLVVDRGTEGHDEVPGDGLCTVAGGGCTLRAAIDEANARPGSERIELTVDVTMSSVGTDDDLNRTGDFDLQSPVVIDGDGHQIDAAGLDRVLDVYEPIELARVTITGGYMEQYPGLFGVGGGVRAWSDLTVRESEIVGNRSVNSDGGGIALARGWNATGPRPVVVIADSTIVDNRAPSDSAFDLGWSQSSIVLRSTITGNVGYNTFSGPISLVASTVVDNQSTFAIGYGVVDVRGSVISATVGTACGPFKPASLGYNVDDASCGFAAVGDRVAATVAFAPLADNGGPTRTRLPYAAGPTIDAIPIGTAGLCDATTPRDQRGAARPAGSGCDIGATEGTAGAAPAAQAPMVDGGVDGPALAPGDDALATAGPPDATPKAADVPIRPNAPTTPVDATRR